METNTAEFYLNDIGHNLTSLKNNTESLINTFTSYNQEFEKFTILLGHYE